MSAEVIWEGNQLLARVYTKTPHTVGSINEGSTALTVRDPAGFANGNTIIVENAGPEGGHLVTTIASVAGNALTLAAAASATVRREVVGKLANPGTVIWSIRKGDGNPATYATGATEVTNPSLGIQELRIVPDEGQYHGNFEGSTPCQCAVPFEFLVPRAKAKG